MHDPTIDDGSAEATGAADADASAGAVTAAGPTAPDPTAPDTAGAAGGAGTVESASRDDLDRLALELGALAAETEGVARVQARPGVVEIARRALGGLRGQPLVTLVVTDDETRVVLDLAVDETASGPHVARDVAGRLLEHLAALDLPDPSIDVRIVAVSS